MSDDKPIDSSTAGSEAWLEALYQESATDVPGAELDAAVLADSRAYITRDTPSAPATSAWHRWGRITASAAVLVVAVGVYLQTDPLQREPDTPSPEPTATSLASTQPDAGLEKNHSTLQQDLLMEVQIDARPTTEKALARAVERVELPAMDAPPAESAAHDFASAHTSEDAAEGVVSDTTGTPAPPAPPAPAAHKAPEVSEGPNVAPPRLPAESRQAQRVGQYAVHDTVRAERMERPERAQTEEMLVTSAHFESAPRVMPALQPLDGSEQSDYSISHPDCPHHEAACDTLAHHPGCSEPYRISAQVSGSRITLEGIYYALNGDKQRLRCDAGSWSLEPADTETGKPPKQE